MIIAIIGAERSGKDTFADFLCKNHGFKKHSMAAPIREMANIIFPSWQNPELNKDIIDPVSGIRPRDFMKWLGTDIFQYQLHQRFPNVNIPPQSIWSQICTNIINSSADDQNWVIPDVRFKHEALALHNLNAHFIYLIPGDSIPKTQSTYDIPHILDNYNHQVFINNKSDGLSVLEKKVAELINQLN